MVHRTLHSNTSLCGAPDVAPHHRMEIVYLLTHFFFFFFSLSTRDLNSWFSTASKSFGEETQSQKCSLLWNWPGCFTAQYCCTANKVTWHESLFLIFGIDFHKTVHNKNTEIKPNFFLRWTGHSNFCLKNKLGCLHAQMWYLWKSGSRYKSCCAKPDNFIASLTLFDSFSEHILLVCSWRFWGVFFFFLTYFLSSCSNTREEEQKVKEASSQKKKKKKEKR